LKAGLRIEGHSRQARSAPGLTRHGVDRQKPVGPGTLLCGGGEGIEVGGVVTLQDAGEEIILILLVARFRSAASLGVDAELRQDVRHQMDGNLLDDPEPHLQILGGAVRFVERRGPFQQRTVNHQPASVDPRAHHLAAGADDT